MADYQESGETTPLLVVSSSGEEPPRCSSTRSTGDVSLDMRSVSGGAATFSSDAAHVNRSFKVREHSVLLSKVKLEWQRVKVSLPPDVPLKERLGNLCGSSIEVTTSGKRILKSGRVK